MNMMNTNLVYRGGGVFEVCWMLEIDLEYSFESLARNVYFRNVAYMSTIRV